MAKYRNDLPQLKSKMFLADAGIETDLIFNHGIEIREFASHTLLPDAEGRAALTNYFEDFLKLAQNKKAGFILDTTTWKAHRHWAEDLGETVEELKAANEDSVNFIVDLRDRFETETTPIVLNAIIGPRGDAYKPEQLIAADDAETYYAEQLAWLAATDIDMITGTTFTQSSESIGLARAAKTAGLPVVISLTVETDGNLPTGQSIGDAIEAIDEATDSYPVYYMINCAHPTHFAHALKKGEGWMQRIKGIRANASTCSHEELDNAEELDDGDPGDLAARFRAIRDTFPHVTVLGGCCGTDRRHIEAIAEACL